MNGADEETSQQQNSSNESAVSRLEASFTVTSTAALKDVFALLLLLLLLCCTALKSESKLLQRTSLVLSSPKIEALSKTSLYPVATSDAWPLFFSLTLTLV